MVIRVINLRRKNILLGTAVLMFILGIVLDFAYYHNRVYPGIYLKNVPLGRKSLAEAGEIIGSLEMSFSGPEGRIVSFPLARMGVTPSVDQIVDSSYHLGRQGRWPFTYYIRWKIRKEKEFTPLRFRLDRSRLQKGVRTLAAAFDTGPTDAQFQVSDGKGILIPEKNGCRIDQEKLTQKLLQNLNQLDSPFFVEVPYEEISPKITVSGLKQKGVATLISSFSAAFDPGLTSRVHNIKLAASIINNQLVGPGETFSLNDLLGEITEAKGYQKGLAIIDGDYRPAVGGGLCQVSSALYNAALLANLDIIERHSHQFTAPYVPAGRDAAMTNIGLDLKFRNTGDYPILIAAEVISNRVVIGFFSAPMTERVEIITRTLAVFPHSQREEWVTDLAPGKEKIIKGKPGCVVEVWRVVYRGKTVVVKQKMSVDTYQPYPTLVLRGLSKEQ